MLHSHLLCASYGVELTQVYTRGCTQASTLYQIKTYIHSLLKCMFAYISKVSPNLFLTNFQWSGNFQVKLILVCIFQYMSKFKNSVVNGKSTVVTALNWLALLHEDVCESRCRDQCLLHLVLVRGQLSTSSPSCINLLERAPCQLWKGGYMGSNSGRRGK